MFLSNGHSACPWQLMKLDNLFLYFKDGGFLEDKVAVGLRTRTGSVHTALINELKAPLAPSQKPSVKLMGKWYATCHGGVIPHGPWPLSCLSLLLQSFSISSFPEQVICNLPSSNPACLLPSFSGKDGFSQDAWKLSDSWLEEGVKSSPAASWEPVPLDHCCFHASLS